MLQKNLWIIQTLGFDNPFSILRRAFMKTLFAIDQIPERFLTSYFILVPIYIEHGQTFYCFFAVKKQN